MRNHLHRSFAVALALVAALSLVVLRSASAGETERKLAVELTQMVVSKDGYLAMLDQMSTNMMAAMQQSGAKVAPGDAAKVKAAVADILPYEEVVKWNAEIYSAKFTADELRDLIKFYSTPTGKKIARLLPEITGEVGKKVGPLVAQRLPAALKKHGIQ
jgi:uncharacterized protein